MLANGDSEAVGCTVPYRCTQAYVTTCQQLIATRQTNLTEVRNRSVKSDNG